MIRLIAAGVILSLACGAQAGGNPDIRMYIDFDPPNYVHEVQPELYTTFEAHVCIDRIGEGVSVVSFAMNDVTEDCLGVVAAPSFVANFLPPP